MADEWKIPFRYVWQVVILLIGVAIAVLGVVALVKDDFSITNTRGWDAAFIPFGLMVIAEAIFLLVRRIPRFPKAGEQKRRAEEQAVDTIVAIVIFVVGVVAAMIVGFVVK